MKNVLNNLKKPEDIKKLSIVELEQLAVEIRGKICDVVSINGGHLAPNLGVVELTLALHAIFDCPGDKIVWDVGHQAYTHKMITGRMDQFDTIRTEGGISGFPNISESESDAFGTGHAATAISAALGLAAARDIKKTDEKIVAVVGDGAMTNGLSFEGLNNAGASKCDILVILNDNKMSISPNVGAFPKYLTGVISDQRYNKLKKDIWDLTGLIPKVGKPARTILNRLERGLKTFLVPGSWFENLGFRYFGPIDGHDIGQLMQILSQLKNIKGPILLHTYTTKGKGYCFAEEDAVRFHGTSAFEKTTGKVKRKATRPSYSKIFGDTLVTLADKNESICAITAAMTDSTGLGPFSEKYPDRFFDVGIAEGHAVTFAAGLARGGLKPFISIYSSFIQRSYDNIIHDVALQKLPVTFCLDRAGFVGEDGPTHHGLLDLSFMRQIPGMIVMAPQDENELRDMLKFASEYKDGPVSIRYPKGSGTAGYIRKGFEPIELGKAEVLREGGDAVILAIGEVVQSSLKSANMLAEDGIEAMVVNMRFASPLDSELLDRVLNNGRPVITVEENSVVGGFGAAVMEYCSQNGLPRNISMIGVPGKFTDQAERSRLLSMYKLDAKSIAETVRKVVKS
jgi:1-deoxy-D-xylulose-5-phosphate synthase